jgi:tripartite-type tricarboxylate transporter receptor subunit TctC
MKLQRRTAIALLLAIAAAPALAQPAFPAKPVRVLVGFPAGSGPDIVARMIAQKLSEIWNGASVLVENKPGAGSMLAATETARAAPDGYTLLLGTSSQISITPHSYKNPPIDAEKDFVPVSQVVSTDFALLVNPQKVPARNIKEFAAFVKAQPKGYFMGSFGAGTPGHFGAYILGDLIAAKPEMVHYKNTGDVLTGLINGDVQGVFGTGGFVLSSIQGGKLAAIGSAGPKRMPSLPDVSTIKEQGFPIEFTSWFGIFAPAGTPAPVIARISAGIQEAARDPEWRKTMETAGFDPTGTSGQAFEDLIRRDTVVWGKAVNASGFRAD